MLFEIIVRFLTKDKANIFRFVTLGSFITFAGCVGISSHPVPSEDVLQKSVVEVGRSMGLEEAYQDSSEGIFIWRVHPNLSNKIPASDTCTGLFAWYMKRLSNGVAVVDPMLWKCALETSAYTSEIKSESVRLQIEFERRWHAAVGLGELIPATQQTHSVGLLNTVLALLNREQEVRILRKSLPLPPNGFNWRQLREINAAIPVPEGWYVKRVVARPVEAVSYFVSRENIDINGSFEEGLSLDVLIPRPQSTADEVNVTLKGVVANVCKTGQIIKPIWERSQNNFQHYGCLVRENGKRGAFLLHLHMMVNKKTNTAYQFIFESPESRWEESWIKGTKMMDQFMVDENI